MLNFGVNSFIPCETVYIAFYVLSFTSQSQNVLLLRCCVTNLHFQIALFSFHYLSFDEMFVFFILSLHPFYYDLIETESVPDPPRRAAGGSISDTGN